MLRFERLDLALKSRVSLFASEVASECSYTDATGDLSSSHYERRDVGIWPVRRTAMIEKTYGHLGEVRHRSEVVEYRGEQHAAKLRDRLARLVPVAVTSGNRRKVRTAA